MLLRVSCGVRLYCTMMYQATKAGKAGDWADLVRSDRLNAWKSVKLRDWSREVEQERRPLCSRFSRRAQIY